MLQMRGMKIRDERHRKEKKKWNQKKIQLNDFCKNKYSKENVIRGFVGSLSQFFLMSRNLSYVAVVMIAVVDSDVAWLYGNTHLYYT